MNLLYFKQLFNVWPELQASSPMPALPHSVRGPESYEFDLQWAVYTLVFLLVLGLAWVFYFFLRKFIKNKRAVSLHQSSIEKLRSLIPEEPFDKQSQVEFLHKADLLFRSIFFSTTGFKAQSTTLSEFKTHLKTKEAALKEGINGVLEVLAQSEQIKFSKKTFSKADAQNAKRILVNYSEKLIAHHKATEDKKRKTK